MAGLFFVKLFLKSALLPRELGKGWIFFVAAESENADLVADMQVTEQREGHADTRFQPGLRERV